MEKTNKIVAECTEHKKDYNEEEIIESKILIKTEKLDSRSSLNEVPLSQW